MHQREDPNFSFSDTSQFYHYSKKADTCPSLQQQFTTVIYSPPNVNISCYMLYMPSYTIGGEFCSTNISNGIYQLSVLNLFVGFFHISGMAENGRLVQF